jgi:hypothetical protein
MGATNSAEETYLKHILNQTSFAANASHTIHLYTAMPTDAGSGTEVGGGIGYTAPSITNSISGSTWVAGTSATPSIKANAAIVDFGTVISTWGTILGWGIKNAAGTLIHFQAFDASFTPSTAGDTVKFAAGALTIAFDFKTDYLSKKMADLVFGASTFTPPASLTMKAYTSVLTSAGTGTEVSSSGTGYASVAITSNTTNWNVPSSGSVDNKIAFSFAAATGDWTTVNAVGFWDGSNLIFLSNLSSGVAVASGNVFRFAAGDIDITLD